MTSMPKERKEELKEAMWKDLERDIEEVRACPMTGGSLEQILTRAARSAARVRAEMLARIASEEADFPPSRVSEVRSEEDVQPEAKTENSDDVAGHD